MNQLSHQLPELDVGEQKCGMALIARQDEVFAAFSRLRDHEIVATKIRIHGDYHLGQVLFTGDDFVIMDFEGEPARSLAERRAKHPPLRDVAGMSRSFHYAAHAAGGTDAENWATHSQQAFLDGWRAAVAGSAIEYDAVSERELLRFFLIEKALYEVDYELNNRPGWLAIPLRGVLSLLGGA